MFKLSEEIQKKIVYLFCIIVITYIVKPSILFKPNGKPRVYGIGYDYEGYKKTLYTFQFAIIIFSLFVNYFWCTLIKNIIKYVI
jgi:hypothetical protein